MAEVMDAFMVQLSGDVSRASIRGTVQSRTSGVLHASCPRSQRVDGLRRSQLDGSAAAARQDPEELQCFVFQCHFARR